MTRTDDTVEITQLFEDWNAALATRDPEVVADLYAPDAVLLPTLSNTPRRDRAAIVDYFRDFLANAPQGRITDATTRHLGDVAVHSGVYIFTLSDKAGTRDAPARFTFVYRRDPEGWRIIEHHSSLMPE